MNTVFDRTVNVFASSKPDHGIFDPTYRAILRKIDIDLNDKKIKIHFFVKTIAKVSEMLYNHNKIKSASED